MFMYMYTIGFEQYWSVSYWYALVYTNPTWIGTLVQTKTQHLEPTHFEVIVTIER